MSQTVQTCKEKKYIQWKIHRNKSTSLFKSRLVTINGALGYIIKSIQYKQFPQCTHYKQFPQCTQYPQKKSEKKKGEGDKGERHNEKKTRRRRRREKDGDRGERKKKKQMRKQWRRIGEEKEKKRGEV